MRGAPTPTRWLVFDAESVTHVDAAGVAAIRDLAQHLGDDGTTLVFARVKSPLRARFDEVGLTEEIGERHFQPTVRAAVEACVSGE